jgi:hypothetical protein
MWPLRATILLLKKDRDPPQEGASPSWLGNSTSQPTYSPLRSETTLK